MIIPKNIRLVLADRFDVYNHIRDSANSAKLSDGWQCLRWT